QVPTMSRALPVAMPFLVNGVLTSNGMKEVVVRHLTKGKPTDVRVAVRQILPTEEAIISALLPSSTLSYLRARGDDPTVPRVGASFATMLGAVDIPFGGGSWSNPHSARRHEVHLEVEALLARPADIEQAVLDCFKCDAVAAALASLLTPAGWV